MAEFVGVGIRPEDPVAIVMPRGMFDILADIFKNTELTLVREPEEVGKIAPVTETYVAIPAGLAGPLQEIMATIERRQKQRDE